MTATLDPTTAAMVAQIDERDHFRTENARLGRALVTALAEIEVLKASAREAGEKLAADLRKVADAIDEGAQKETA